MMPLRIKRFFWPLAALLAAAIACNLPGDSPVSTPDPIPTLRSSAQTAAPAITLPASSGGLLTVCMGQEPASLFLYSDGSAAARNVRQALYDGPYDVVNYQVTPVILEAIPTANAGAAYEPAAVQAGSLVINAAGVPASLADGVRVLPAGCNDAACAVDFSSQAPVQMDQMVVRFKLLSRLKWSDGEPLTADDSVYSYELARAMYPKVRADLIDRTVSYQAVDETTIEWRGIAGYRTSAVASLFFTPLPRHAWGSLALNDLLASDIVNRQPVGWGPYKIDEWTAGDHITLSKNSNYFHSGEGLPAFDRLVFRFITDRNQALSALQAGECDLLDETNHLELQLQALDGLKSSGKANVIITPGIAWEHLDFGVQAIAAPDGGGPSAFFGLKETRQAAAYCIDRQRLANEQFPGQTVTTESYISPSHPLYNPQVRTYAYDYVKGAELLTAAGWLDSDNNPATARLAQGVAGVPDGTAFEVTLYTTADDEKGRAAQIIQEGLAGCGVKVNISAGPVETVFAPGPEGPVFGRNFALAQFGWTSSLEPPCALYTTIEIPGPYPQYSRGWGGANASGYSSADFDRACRQAQGSLPGTPEYQAAHQQAQAIYAEDLPSLPLYLRLRAAVSRPDLCALPADPSSDSMLVSLETLRLGASCP